MTKSKVSKGTEKNTVEIKSLKKCETRILFYHYFNLFNFTIILLQATCNTEMVYK